MKLIIITKGNGPEMREALSLGERVETDGYSVEYHDYEDYESENLIRLYDIYNPPAEIIVEDDGRMVEMWHGFVPTENEVTNFMRM